MKMKYNGGGAALPVTQRPPNANMQLTSNNLSSLARGGQQQMQKQNMVLLNNMNPHKEITMEISPQMNSRGKANAISNGVQQALK